MKFWRFFYINWATLSRVGCSIVSEGVVEALKLIGRNTTCIYVQVCEDVQTW